MRERELIEWIQNRAPATGDDCAVLPCEPWGELLVTVDAVIDGVHARWSEDGPRAFGYKAVARGLSDIAAMGGTPLWVVLAATLPPGTSNEDARAVVLGAEDAGCPLVGGDTVIEGIHLCLDGEIDTTTLVEIKRQPVHEMVQGRLAEEITDDRLDLTVVEDHRVGLVP